MKKNKAAVLGFMGAVFFAASAYACAPDFDNAYFVRSSEEHYLAIPDGSFLFELKRIGGDKNPMVITEGVVKRVADADLDDLQKALKDRKVTGKDFDAAVASYRASREAINSFLAACPVGDSSQWYGARFRNQDSGGSEPVIKLSPKVPQEFRLYLSGAAKYHANDFQSAIQEWQKILKLPDSERKFKSTWAAFMTGKAYLSFRDQAKAVPYFINTRELAEKGFTDSLGLASESYGWQALAEYEQKNYVSSIKHYLKPMDVSSLNLLCSKVSEMNDGSIEKIVKDETARGVLLSWAISRPCWDMMEWENDGAYKDFLGKLLSAIEGIKKDGPVDYADRVAWLYYIKGDAASTRKWLACSKATTPLSQFIDYKLTLRDGKIDEAITKLSKVMSSFEKSKDKDMFPHEDVGRLLNSNMALLKLNRKEYLKAFDLVLQGKYWEDIAYIAEKVLTAKELEDYLKSSGDEKILSKRKKFYRGHYLAAQNRLKTHPDEIDWYADEVMADGPSLRESLEYLLARKLARQGEWDWAAKYMPEKWKPEYEQGIGDFSPRGKLKELQGLLAKAANGKNSVRSRAQAYYDAGVIMRKYGMELVGTELDPDGYVFYGGYPYYYSVVMRFGIFTDEAKAAYGYEQWSKQDIEWMEQRRTAIKERRGFFCGSEDEEVRVMGSLPDPNKRFHYRYKAADLMWKSAHLLPDNDNLKAKALCAGGTFVKGRDSELADEFYKALVKTCGRTELGKQADKLKWFPKTTFD